MARMAVHQVEQLLLLDHENQELQEMYNEIAEVSIVGIILDLSSSSRAAAVLSTVWTYLIVAQQLLMFCARAGE
jgi:hypothetical protein